MISRLIRVGGALLATALTVPLLAGIPAVAGTGPAVPTLTWGACPDAIPAPFECATAEVPLDYEHPKRRTIGVVTVRRPAQQPSARIGSLFVNPGGPGGDGIDYVVRTYDRLPQVLKDRFDVVGFDPRGTDRSAPVSCFTREEYDAAFRATRLYGPERTGFDEATARARQLVRSCVQRSGDLLPYIGTEYVARDMDLLRAAVGDPRLTYLGLSYGSYLGTVYANLFPHRVRALALDGAIDPVAFGRRVYVEDRGQNVALRRSLDRFLAWCAAKHAECGFGNGDPAGALDRLLADLDANPRIVHTPDGPGTINATTYLIRANFALAQGRRVWRQIGSLLAANAAGIFPPQSGPFSRVTTDFFGRGTAISCVDRAYPYNLRLLERKLAEHARAGGRFGRPFSYGPPAYDQSQASACVQWPEAAGERAPSRYTGGYRARGAAPILVIGVTGDPDVPYRDAVELARTLDRAYLLTLDGESHTAFLKSECSTAAIAGYLVDTRRPTVRVCADEPQPQPV